MFEPVLLKYIDDPNQKDIETYIGHGGYQAVKKVLTEFTPDAVIDTVKRSGLRGRGGAGFPAGIKWSFVPKDPNLQKYLICNADEGEPGTFKDRKVIEKDPHQLIEGMIIAAYAIGSRRSFIYIRGEYADGAEVLGKAIQEAYDKGFLGKNICATDYSLDISVHRGAGAYVCGEETSLIESLEGSRGYPRLRPPFPAIAGLYKSPTVVNNVETLSNVPHIINRGAEWFAGIGSEKSPGPKIFPVSGHVNKPGVYELPMGTPLREIIYEHAGGILNGRELKAVIPGGISTPVLTPDQIDVEMDFNSLMAIGSMLGSGAVIVMDETTCMVKMTLRMIEFFRHESCGKCTPCREGTDWLQKILNRIMHGGGRMEDIDLMMDLCEGMLGMTFCPLGDAATSPVTSTIQKFRDEYIFHIENKRCPNTVI